MTDVQANLQFAAKKDEISNYSARCLDLSAISIVQEAAKNQTLTLVLGAGISKDLNLPLWPELVAGLYADVYARIDSSIDSSAILGMLEGDFTSAVLIRHLEILAGFDSRIRLMVRDRLYRALNKDGAKALILPLCDLFLRPEAPSPVNHVITYNFDNMLEQNLRQIGRKDVTSIYSDTTYPLKIGGVRIYHPHGFLPDKADDPSGAACNECVIFSEREYNVAFMDTGNWANILQLHHFMNRTCLFIGCSVTDPNLRRLLDHARNRTQSGTRHVSIQKTDGDKHKDYFVETDLRSLGISTAWVAKFEDIPSFLGKCANR